MKQIKKISIKKIKLNMIMVWTNSSSIGDPFYYIGIIKMVNYKQKMFKMLWLNSATRYREYHVTKNIIREYFKKDIHFYETDMTSKRFSMYFNLFNPCYEEYNDIS